MDDGKSTLIGRLLHDTSAIPDDQLAALAHATRRRGEAGVNLALLTDGLRAEREQNITIDVAYRYFATPRRAFVLADTPGHAQYTRNMVTGASTADLAVVLVDARHGVVTQSRRHGFLAALLGVPHLVVAVNKMDLVGWARPTFEAIAGEYARWAAALDVGSLTFVPLSALLGDNVVAPSARMSWYRGPTLLECLERAEVGAPARHAPFRMPVQYVVRAGHDFRGLAGRVASGVVAVGDEVVALPAGRPARVRAIVAGLRARDAAAAGDSVVLTLDAHLDVARGDTLAARDEPAAVATRLDAMVCWLDDAPSDPETSYVLLHGTRAAAARVRRVEHRIDVDTLRAAPAHTLGLNDVARVLVEATVPLAFDPYAANRATGSFVLVDPYSHRTVAAGMIRGEAAPPVSPGVTWAPWNVPREERERRHGHPAAVVWFTGLPAAGKSTIARAVERRLWDLGLQTVLLDGDQLRHGLTGDLGFSAADRTENVRRTGEVARLFFEAGHVVLCALVSPVRADRARPRAAVPPGAFLEVFVDCPVEECRRRDPKGLYARAARGELAGLTGVDAPYEAPGDPELRVDTAATDVAAAVEQVLGALRARGVIPAGVPPDVA